MHFLVTDVCTLSDFLQLIESHSRLIKFMAVQFSKNQLIDGQA